MDDGDNKAQMLPCPLGVQRFFFGSAAGSASGMTLAAIERSNLAIASQVSPLFITTEDLTMLARKIVIVATALMLPLACGDDGNEVQDEIEGTADCTQICSKYNECVTNVDETGCIDLCEDTADGSQAGEEAAENCEDCLDGKTCQEAESCWATCPVAVVDE